MSIFDNIRSARERCAAKKKKYFYTVIAVSNTEFISVVNSLDEASVVIDKLLRLKYDDHFKKWAEFRNLKVDDVNSWYEYEETCIPIEDVQSSYAIIKTSYTMGELASIIRMFTCCVPLGLPFEGDMESAYYLASSIVMPATDLSSSPSDATAGAATDKGKFSFVSVKTDDPRVQYVLDQGTSKIKDILSHITMSYGDAHSHATNKKDIPPSNNTASTSKESSPVSHDKDSK